MYSRANTTQKNLNFQLLVSTFWTSIIPPLWVRQCLQHQLHS